MIGKIYIYLRVGKSINFYSLEDLNLFLKENNFKKVRKDAKHMVSVSNDDKNQVMIIDPVTFFGLKKYGYDNANDLILINYDNTDLIIDPIKPAAFALEPIGMNCMIKARELAVSSEIDSNSCIRRIRINDKKVSISTLIKKYNSELEE